MKLLYSLLLPFIWTWKVIQWIIGSVFMAIIRFYQIFLSPILPSSCRFTPTCSRYGLEAIRKYGPFKGGYLAARRISRCHPWNEGGHDPVP